MTHGFLAFGLLLSGLVLNATAQSPAPADFQPEVATLHPAPALPPSTLRVVSFNVHYAREPFKLARILSRSKELAQADVLLVQEIENHPHEGSSRVARLASALKLNYVYAPARTTEDGDTHGLAILSRYPLRDIEVIRLPQYFKTRRRIAVAATVEVGQTALRVYNLHLDTRLNLHERLEQLRPVIERARADSAPRVVVGGDFNTNPFRWLARLVPIFRSNQANGLDEFMRQQGFETQLARAGPTTRFRGFIAVRVDTLYTRGLQVRASGVAYNVKGSDHMPVWIEVSWP